MTANVKIPGKSKARSALEARNALTRAKRTNRCFDLLMAGKNYREIAAELKIDPHLVGDLVKEATEKYPAPNVEAWRNSLIETNQSVIAAHWEKRQRADSAKVIMQATKMIADLTGSFARKEIDVSGKIVTADMSEELLSRLARLAAESTDDPDIEVTLMEPEHE